MDVRPHVEKFAILVEDLNTVVGAIGDVDAAVAIRRHGGWGIELPWSGPRRSPGHQVLPILIELHDAGVAVAVADEERAVGQPGPVGGAVEGLFALGRVLPV